jgi:hypothetical protein
MFTAALLPAAVVVAQPAPAAAPATAPATTQASIPVDQTTPRGALKVLTVAMNKGDADKVKAVFAPSNPMETKMVNAVLTQQATIMQFHDAAVAAFGADEAKKLPPGDTDAAVAQSLLALDKFPESITGDTATVGEGDAIIHLKKQGDNWTLPVSLLAPQITADNVDQQLAQMSEQGKILSDLTTEMKAGKYKTVEDAGKALQLKALQQAMAHAGAASQPSTAPATPAAPAAPQGPG